MKTTTLKQIISNTSRNFYIKENDTIVFGNSYCLIKTEQEISEIDKAYFSTEDTPEINSVNAIINKAEKENTEIYSNTIFVGEIFQSSGQIKTHSNKKMAIFKTDTEKIYTNAIFLDFIIQFNKEYNENKTIAFYLNKEVKDSPILVKGDLFSALIMPIRL